MEMVGLAKVRRTPPQLKLGAVKPVADGQTLEALIANRYEVMANYARGLRSVCSAELDKLKAQGAENSQRWAQMRLAHRWLHRDDDKIPAAIKHEVDSARALSPALDKLVVMREELRQLWTRSNVSAEQLVIDLQEWCRKAEQSGIAVLQQFSVQLRAVRA
jgi:stearoyl-CoA desaturase (delta-9 desaturase)